MMKSLALLLFALLVPSPINSTTGPLPAPNPQGPMRSLVQPFVQDNKIAGAVIAVAGRDKVIDVETFGYADVAAKKPMTEDTIFWLASMTKSMTTACVLMLVDEGKVKLDDPIEKYLPEFKNQRVLTKAMAADTSEGGGNGAATENAKPTTSMADTVPASHPITLREVMSHSSGIQPKSDLERNPLDRYPLDVLVRAYAKQPLLFQPGTGFKYSNAGIHTAARVLEVVTGMKYEDFIQQRLWNPLGMKDTTFWPTPEQVQRLAKSYVIGNPNKPVEEHVIEQLQPDLTDRKHRYPVPAGGAFSTAADLVAFTQMILNNGVYHGKRLLSEASVRAATTKETPPAVKYQYGFGWYTDADGSFRHGGAFKTEMDLDPKTGTIAVLLMQVAGGGGWPEDHGVNLRAEVAKKALTMDR